MIMKDPRTHRRDWQHLNGKARRLLLDEFNLSVLSSRPKDRCNPAAAGRDPRLADSGGQETIEPELSPRDKALRLIMEVHEEVETQ